MVSYQELQQRKLTLFSPRQVTLLVCETWRLRESQLCLCPSLLHSVQPAQAKHGVSSKPGSGSTKVADAASKCAQIQFPAKQPMAPCAQADQGSWRATLRSTKASDGHSKPKSNHTHQYSRSEYLAARVLRHLTIVMMVCCNIPSCHSHLIASFCHLDCFPH